MPSSSYSGVGWGRHPHWPRASANGGSIARDDHGTAWEGPVHLPCASICCGGTAARGGFCRYTLCGHTGRPPVMKLVGRGEIDFPSMVPAGVIPVIDAGEP